MSAASGLFALITGASQGYGRAIASALATAMKHKKVSFVLAARSLGGLEETAAQITKVRKSPYEISSHGFLLTHCAADQ